MSMIKVSLKLFPKFKQSQTTKISELRWWECLSDGLKFTALDKILISMFISFWFCDVNSARQIFRPENE